MNIESDDFRFHETMLQEGEKIVTVDTSNAVISFRSAEGVSEKHMPYCPRICRQQLVRSY